MVKSIIKVVTFVALAGVTGIMSAASLKQAKKEGAPLLAGVMDAMSENLGTMIDSKMESESEETTEEQ